MNILFLSRWLPYPPANGSKLRIYNLLRGLAGQHRITLLTFADPAEMGRSLAPLEAICARVQLAPWRAYNPASARARRGLFSLTPRSVLDTFSPDMQRHIETTLAAEPFDLVIASQLDMAAYAPWFAGRPALFEEVEIGVLYEQFARASAVWDRLRYGLTWLKYRRYLARLMTAFHTCTVVSEQERRLLGRALPTPRSIEVVPNCISLADYAGVDRTRQPYTLVFTGSFRYFANHHAMVWFMEQVYPLIKAALPQTQLMITGDHAGLPLPPARDVTLTGFVDDVRPLIAGAAVSLAPIWQGGGTRLKILEAMALNTPVVATSKGAEGLEAQPGRHLLVADTPPAFAQAVIRLLTDEAQRRAVAEAAFELVREKYDWAATMPHFLKVIGRAAQA
jgi:glycosyltransferase involved in cell wall biosynthesis